MLAEGPGCHPGIMGMGPVGSTVRLPGPGKGGSRLSSLLHNALVNAELFVFFIIINNNC